MDVFSPLVQVFEQSLFTFYSVVVVLSLAVGSFLNVVIYRLPKMMELAWQQDYQQYFNQNADQTKTRFNLALPRSHCPKCQHPLSAMDNIPLFSWLLLKAKCRYCKAPISARYPSIEAFTALLSLLVAMHFGVTEQTLIYVVVTWCLIALSFIDIDKMLLPDQITQPLLWFALLLSVTGWTVSPTDALIGAAAGYLSLWSVFWLFKLVTGKEGMGYGDFKLLAIFGALLGWQLLPLIILLSSVVGAVLGSLMLLLQGKGKATPIPFGPYIAAAGWIAMLWGKDITAWYLSTMGL
ncbi:prepilin peptidase [Rheinheimera mesophila]|uniref:Prepilin leader peptidase/N-methyltransferase n=1 Tax=Rheinheimera mesophila TaxID=1547515 RepID=A0A3P3QJG2_9GAMM|nr:A24 family peptidase [Rheinheimera mesophila]KKL02528.1 methyltransferase [Rheinheimera mesophila]RRJ21281.1 prepilin peptidase [Rheinheimera mesophila]